MDVLRIFNLQLFAEDDFEDNQTDSDTVVDETGDDVNKTEDDEINIPEEFEGLDQILLENLLINLENNKS